MPKYIIRVFSSFWSSTDCKNIFESINNVDEIENYGKTKDIYITDDDNYTHVIILNTAMPLLQNIPKENVIGFAFEPPHFLGLNTQFLDYAKKYISKYYIGQLYDLPSPFIESQGFLSYNKPLRSMPIVKPHLMSIMVSQKTSAPGHQYRHELVQHILASNLPIDIMGRGCAYYPPDIRLKGEFNGLEPYESYQFHIAIENFQLNHYFSEKIIDPLFCGTTPVYLGCTNIDTYFPDMVIKLTGVVRTDMILLIDILNNPQTYKKRINIDAVKNTTSLIKNIPRLFSSSCP